MRIAQDGDLMTLINVFETTPERQQALIEQWFRFTEEVKKEPGYIATALRCIEAQTAPAWSTTRTGDPRPTLAALCRSITSSSRSSVCTPHAWTHTSTRWSLSMSGFAIDGPANARVGASVTGLAPVH